MNVFHSLGIVHRVCITLKRFIHRLQSFTGFRCFFLLLTQRALANGLLFWNGRKLKMTSELDIQLKRNFAASIEMIFRKSTVTVSLFMRFIFSNYLLTFINLQIKGR